MQEDSRIKVVDSPVGTGKTTWSINYINSLPEDTKIIFITPFLTEVDRIKDACPGKNFVAPNRKIGKGSKRNHLLKLIVENKNIVSTHSLFANIDDELIAALTGANYILILDEAMNVLQKFDFWDDETDIATYDDEEEEKISVRTEREIDSLKSKGVIEIDPDTGQISWMDKENQWAKYETFQNLVKRNLMFLVDKRIVVWTFPSDVFSENVFREIYILTYQFDWQIQAAYYRYFDLEYSKYHVEKINGEYSLVKTIDDNYEREWIAKAKELITIIETPSLNKVGTILKTKTGHSKTSLSKQWYLDNPSLVKIVSNNCANFFMNYTDTKAVDRLWTSFISEKNKMTNGSLSKKNWLAINARATNNYSNKTALAYTINRYINPFIIHFFGSKNVKIEQDEFALSELIQWVWRSAVRNNKPITLYIPSDRMRTLFQQYLNGEEIGFRPTRYNLD